MTHQDDYERIVKENVALKKTVAALMRRAESINAPSTSSFDFFTQSILLQRIVARRTNELEQITESSRKEAVCRRQAEESMYRERSLLVSVISHIPHLVCWKDCDRIFRGCNPAFAHRAGLPSPNAVVGLTQGDIRDAFPMGNHWCEREQQVLDTRKPAIGVEEEATGTAGEDRVFLTSMVPMLNDAGEPDGLVTISMDITERKMLECQLAQAQKLESIGQLAAGIAHEINTPAQYVSDNARFMQAEFDGILQVIDHYAEQLNSESQPLDWQDRARATREMLERVDYSFLREEIPQALAQSVEGIERITHIVKAMKDFSHPGSSEMEIANLNEAIRSTATVCSNRWKYAADLNLELDPGLPLVSCLLAEFNQVMLNLIVNAADAIESKRGPDDPKGLITIRSRMDGDYAVIEVVDDGGGIPEHCRERIFDPFFTTKEVGKGTGQGLAISRDVIANKHHGSLTFRTRTGIGTTFEIRLPLQGDTVQEVAA